MPQQSPEEEPQPHPEPILMTVLVPEPGVAAVEEGAEAQAGSPAVSGLRQARLSAMDGDELLKACLADEPVSVVRDLLDRGVPNPVNIHWLSVSPCVPLCLSVCLCVSLSLPPSLPLSLSVCVRVRARVSAPSMCYVRIGWSRYPSTTHTVRHAALWFRTEWTVWLAPLRCTRALLARRVQAAKGLR